MFWGAIGLREVGSIYQWTVKGYWRKGLLREVFIGREGKEIKDLKERGRESFVGGRSYKGEKGLKRGLCGNHRVHRVAMTTFWRTFHPEGKITPAWWGWGVPFHFIYHHVQSCIVRSSWEGRYTLLIFLLYPYINSVVNPFYSGLYKGAFGGPGEKCWE